MPHFSLINLRRWENFEFPKWPSLSSVLCFPCHLINWWCKRLKGGQDWQTEVCKLEAGGEQEDQNINTRPKCQGNVAKKLRGNPHRSSSKSTDIFTMHSHLQRECGPWMLGLGFQTRYPKKTRGIRVESPLWLKPHMQNSIPGQRSSIKSQGKLTLRTGPGCKTQALLVSDIYTRAVRRKHDA